MNEFRSNEVRRYAYGSDSDFDKPLDEDLRGRLVRGMTGGRPVGDGNDYYFCPHCLAIAKTVYWTVAVAGYGTHSPTFSAQCPVCHEIQSPPPHRFTLDPDYTRAIAAKTAALLGPEPPPRTPAQEQFFAAGRLPPTPSQ